jgi:hypothetical protein
MPQPLNRAAISSVQVLLPFVPVMAVMRHVRQVEGEFGLADERDARSR